MTDEVLKQVNLKMNEAYEYLRQELNLQRTSRATSNLVEDIIVELYGQKMAIKQIANIAVPDAKSLIIKPWDRIALAVIEKALRENKSLDLNPVNDGNSIRLNIPPLTGDKRIEIVKQMKEKVERGRISLRNIRHEAFNKIKDLEKQRQATQDDVNYAEKKLNKMVEEYHTKIEAEEKNKEKEIMEI